MLSVHDSVIQRIMDQLHRDALKKLKRLNLRLCVLHLDVVVRFMDDLCLLKWTRIPSYKWQDVFPSVYKLIMRSIVSTNFKVSREETLHTLYACG